jgi:hypothetical protein
MKAELIIAAVEGVTRKWAKQRKREERESSAASNRFYAMTRRCHVSIKEAAWQIMEQAYMKASASGTLPAHARQIMYAARGHVQRTADRPLGKDFDRYFTQTLLPDYIEETEVDWNVVYDARGRFTEPHTRVTVPLGTLPVRSYLGRVRGHEVPDLDFDIGEKHYPTLGPKNRYGAILFIEKEGFMPLFEAVNLAERYDLAAMSTKGMSVTASRELLDDVCEYHDIPLLVLHDFDKAGFSILGTLHQNTRRYCYRTSINVIDLGLRLEDIAGLEMEQAYIADSPDKAKANLRANGATEEEIEFLLHSRVELNALASDELIAFIERKLAEHGIDKVIPDKDTLAAAYRRIRRQAVVQQAIDKAIAELGDEDQALPVPRHLKSLIAKRLNTDRATSWDAALREIVEDDHETLP